MPLTLGGFTTLLQVFDMPVSLAFYRDLLGFQVVSDVPDDGRCDWAMMKLHGSELMLNTAYEAEERPYAPDVTRVAVHRDTTLYFDCADVEAAYLALQARGVAAKAPFVTHYGMKQVYFNDPDGYEICLQEPVRQE